jgi:hypothetical protein
MDYCYKSGLHQNLDYAIIIIIIRITIRITITTTITITVTITITIAITITRLAPESGPYYQGHQHV